MDIKKIARRLKAGEKYTIKGIVISKVKNGVYAYRVLSQETTDLDYFDGSVWSYCYTLDELEESVNYYLYKDIKEVC